MAFLKNLTSSLFPGATAPSSHKYIFTVAGDDGVGKSHIEKTLNSDEFQKVRASFGFLAEQHAAVQHRYITRTMQGVKVENENVIGNVVVVDVTKRESFDGLSRHITPDFQAIPNVIVANKCDLIDDRVVTLEELEKYAEEHHTKVFEGGFGLENNYFQAVGYLLEQSLQWGKHNGDTSLPRPAAADFFNITPIQGDEKQLANFLHSHPITSADSLGGLTKSAAKV